MPNHGNDDQQLDERKSRAVSLATEKSNAHQAQSPSVRTTGKRPESAAAFIAMIMPDGDAAPLGNVPRSALLK